MATAWNHLFWISGRLKGRVLDAGCGNGEYTRFLNQQPQVEHVTSLDIQARDSVHHGLRFCDVVGQGDYHQGDVQVLPFEDESFDAVLCWDMMQNVPDAHLAVREFARVLRPGGLCTIRLVTRYACPWVTLGVTTECGSSGVTFTVHTLWDPPDAREAAEQAGLTVHEIYVDPWNHLTCLLQKEG